jgi:hypothetical protein
VAVKFDEVGADGRLSKAASERAAVETQSDAPAPNVLASVEIEVMPERAASTGAALDAEAANPSGALANAWN